MRYRPRFLVFLTALAALLSVWAPRAHATVDNTTCTVLNGDDSVDSFNSLRRKIEQGWNRTDFRMCTQLIQFSNVDTIKLNSPLDINNDNALDCQAGDGKPAVCGDGWALVIDGGSGEVTI